MKAGEFDNRPGQIRQFQVNISGGTFTPIVIPILPGNAFYVYDSPFPLIIKTDVSVNQTYQCGTGESFPYSLGRVTIVAPAIGAINNPAVIPTGAVYVVKIWIGPDSHVGFIDHRTQPAPNTTEWLSSISGFSTGVSILSGATNQTVTIPLPVINSWLYNPLLTELMIGNTDTTNTAFLVDITGIYIMPIFPSQVYRVPISCDANALPSPQPLLAGNIYFANPSASPINLVIGKVMRTNSNYLELGQ